MMNNQQIAELFTESVNSFNQPLPLDYRDRAVDLAVYFNDTIPVQYTQQAEDAIEAVRWAMMMGYAAQYNLDLASVERKEEDDPNPGSEEVSRD